MTLQMVKDILMKNVDAIVSDTIVNITDAESIYSTEYYDACAEYLLAEGSDIPTKLKELKAVETECGTYLVNSFTKHLMSSLGL